ncbi:TetR/AcrR family transcriptional regulator [Lichenicoccus roseus]|nr:TetR/AcrR family transcriptional regulator [Lichenicoccus roseus]
MPRPYHHGSLHGALLEAAERILRRDGIGALTLRSVAREAGVSHASPAHHFRDFAELLSALAAVGFTRLRDRMAAEAATVRRGGGARRRGLGRGYVAFARENPNLFLLMFRSDQLDRMHAGLVAAREAAFALLAGENPDTTRLLAATARWSLVHGLSLLAIDGRLQSIASRTALSDEQILDAVLSADAGRRPAPAPAPTW